MAGRHPAGLRHRWQDAIATARTPAARQAVAYDRLRAGLAWLRRRQQFDAAAQAADHALADAISDEVTEALGRFCEQIEHRRAVTRSERHPAA